VQDSLWVLTASCCPVCAASISPCTSLSFVDHITCRRFSRSRNVFSSRYNLENIPDARQKFNANACLSVFVLLFFWGGVTLFIATLIAPPDDRSDTPVQFSSVQFSSVQFSSVQLSSVQFSSVQFSSVQFSSDKFSSVQFSSVQFSSAQFSSVQFSSVQFSSVQFSSDKFSSVQSSPVQFSSVQFSSVQFSSAQFSSVQFRLFVNHCLHPQLL
jgi:uncharacterized protein YjbI with pentapeptide repeats